MTMLPRFLRSALDSTPSFFFFSLLSLSFCIPLFFFLSLFASCHFSSLLSYLALSSFLSLSIFFLSFFLFISHARACVCVCVSLSCPLSSSLPLLFICPYRSISLATTIMHLFLSLPPPVFLSPLSCLSLSL